MLPEGDEADVPVAIYGFTQRGGQLVHDQLGSGPDLFIPRNYLIPRKALLQWPWQDFRYNWRGLQDIAINIAGFFVLGFIVCAWITQEVKPNRPILIAVLLGAALSLLIEVLQFYLPTRTSSLTDVLMNSIGATMGASVWVLRFGEPLLRRKRQFVRNSEESHANTMR
jgi:VanZ family protein